MKKVGRNDPCPCGSGKKYKKCCEKKMIGKKFLATKMEDNPIKSNIAKGVSSLFQNNINSFFSKKNKLDEKLKNSDESDTQEKK